MMGTLAGRRAIVTGAAQGIGRAIAVRFAAEGARVAVLDLPSQGPRALEVVGEIEASGGVAHFVGVDVADRGSVFAAFEQAADALGGVDVVVNNAGIAYVAPLAETDEAAARRIIEVNLLGVLWGIQAAVSLYERQDSGGTIINACSNAGHAGVPMLGVYSSSKFAVRALTQTAAQELATKGITVNAYSPGIVETSMWDDIGAMMQKYTGKAPSDTFGSYVDEIALGRAQTGEDVADLVSFLASPQAGYITGQSIISDGGMVYS